MHSHGNDLKPPVDNKAGTAAPDFSVANRLAYIKPLGIWAEQ